MSELPREAEKILAIAPGDFVQERNRVSKKLRDAGKSDDADAVAGLRKPSAVVFSVNRAARDRPNAAKDAAMAAERVAKAQSSGKQDDFRKALDDLDDALDLLAEVAVAHVSPGKKPSDAMRRRVHDLLRRAAADAETRDALVRGALTEEPEAVGFSPFAGLASAPAKRSGKASAGRTDSRAKRRAEERETRARELRAELADAEEALGAAEKTVRDAERERAKAERQVESIRSRLERLS
jgi:hypothetical protein